MIDLETYYRENYSLLIKRFTRSAGTVWDAEDVVHTAFERALRYQGDREFTPQWFSVILRNSLIDHLNESRGVVFEELDEFDWPAPSNHHYEQMLEVVAEMIQSENPEYQPLLEFHFISGYSAKDIYEFNKFSYPNTRKIIQRFRDKLREKFKEE